ncbi:TolC family protein [Archangium violaceum]|uniref:TolC family protein n=1 Tax=Archangium violaceum TaxID=83451 RepID=UPI00193AE421|nr:TolC family protein [Archangium violaceum]QRK11489.1 TolC family protein [Archangium violaceum]
MFHDMKNRWPRVGATAVTLGALWLAGVARAQASDEPFTGARVLERAELVRQVLERNPGLEAARAAWRAAQARPELSTALEDPMLRYEMAPLSLFSRETSFGQSIELSQRLPFPGKRALAGEVARAEAEAMRGDFEAARLRLALMASMLYDDLYVVHRGLVVNAHHEEVLREMRRAAEAQYVAGRASQQDPLQAEVELGMLERERLMLESQREVLQAQLNGLLHRAPHLPLPPPPETLAVSTESPPPVESLAEEALKQRPELASQRARVGGGDASVKLARRESFPDVMVMGSYSTMWMETPHRFMAGVALELPLFQGKRRAMVDEARGMLQRMKSEEEQLADDIRVEVAQARARLVEARKAVALYRDRVVPAANDQVAAARAGFESGRNGFQVLLDAEKNQRGVELRFEEALADVQRRQAELQRALGRVPGLPEEGSVP